MGLDPVLAPEPSPVESARIAPKFEPEPITAYVLFMDIVKSSQLSADAQRRTNARLKEVVMNTREFQAARTRDELITLPTGDGMALVFSRKIEAPLMCAIYGGLCRRNHSVGCGWESTVALSFCSVTSMAVPSEPDVQ